MKIVVCIKQVPDTTDVKIDPKTNTLIREGVQSILNPFDTYAVEEALRIKEKLGGKVTAVTMGPPQAEAVLREAVSMGVDDVVLISDPAFAGADTLATSYTLAMAVKKLGDTDLLICGKQAIDGDTAQVGPGIAVHLDLPQIVFVKKIREISEDKIVAERMTEQGIEVVESSLPCVITVVKDINEPRLPSLRGKMLAKKKEIPVWKADDLDVEKDKLGLQGSPTMVNQIFAPEKKKGGKIFEGEPSEVVDQFIEMAKEFKLIQ